MGHLTSATPPLSEWRAHSVIQAKVLEAHRLFYFGAPQTELEFGVELSYLDEKAGKLRAYIMTGLNKSAVEWSSKNTQRNRRMANFHNRNLEFFDDFAPIADVFS